MQPNILYIHSHDTGRYIQPYGHAISTPHLQQLADEGVLFRQAFCGNPTCSPSRACLLTGQSAHSNGMVGLAHRGFRLHDYGRHIVHTLRRSGYTSVLAGVQHVASQQDAPSWQVIGYDACLGTGRDAHELAAAFLADSPPEPFFLSVGFFETHREYPEEHPLDDARCCLPPGPLPDTPEIREDMACYKASARELDRKMGHVFAALERTGLASNTLVICTTDHGIAFPGMKCNLTDAGSGVMLIMRGPRGDAASGGLGGGRVVDGLVSHIDVFPTVCDLLGIEPPGWLEGQSLLPLIRGDVAEVNEEIHGEVNYHAAYEPQRMVRTRRWKYIRRFDGRTRPVLPNCDDSLSKTVWMQAGWGGMAPEEERLYDVVFDPNETRNLGAAPEHAEALADMRQRLQAWMSRTADPLLAGHVPAPRGARVNDPDGISPGEPVIEVRT